ncbi:MAG: sialate O-acetylesterase [Kiritimatiellales bacterium]
MSPGSSDPVYAAFYRGKDLVPGLYTFSSPDCPLKTASRIGSLEFPASEWASVGLGGSGTCFLLNRGQKSGLYKYDGVSDPVRISGSYSFSNWHGIGFCNGVYYGLYHGTAMNGAGLYIFMDAADPEGTAVQLCKNRVFSSNVWTDVAFDGERYLFVRTGAAGGDPGIYQYDPDSNEFSKISGSETYTDWQGLGVFDADIAPLKNKKAYVLLFGGQSNALGWGYRQYLLDTGNPLAYPQPDIDMLHGLSLYVPKDTLVPLQSGTANVVVKPQPNHYPDLTNAPISRFSSELSFARRVRDQISIPDVRLGIVKYALGGTSLYDMADWRPDGTADRSADGARYQIFQRTVWKCIAAMKNKYPYYSVEIIGMGWMQGESDAIEGHGEEYEDNLTRFIADVRATFGVADMPFVLSKLSTNQLEGAPEKERIQWPIVTAAQTAVAAADPNVVATDTEGPGYAVSVGYSEGRYHYTTPALLQIGEDLANALMSIRKVN